jgi:hypothetical protein
MDNLSRSIECPVSRERFTDAVTLWPCTHKISRTAATQLFGPANAMYFNPNRKTCPMCRGLVASYADDPTINALAEEIERLQKVLENPALLWAPQFEGVSAKDTLEELSTKLKHFEQNVLSKREQLQIQFDAMTTRMRAEIKDQVNEIRYRQCLDGLCERVCPTNKWIAAISCIFKGFCRR